MKPNLQNAATVLDFGFKDSLTGICVTTLGDVLSTTDGGVSWSLDTSVPNFSGVDVWATLNSVECTAPHMGFYHTAEAELVIAPHGSEVVREYQVPVADSAEEFNGAYLTLAERMYDTAYGFRLVHSMNPLDLNDYWDTVAILVTHDGWRSSKIYGTTLYMPPPHKQVMRAGYIIDSNNIWTSIGTALNENVILHTSDAGATWETIRPFDTMVGFQPLIRTIQVRPESKEIFCFGTNSGVDFAYSTDNGANWSLNSSFYLTNRSNNAWRMFNPASNIVWTVLGTGLHKSIAYSSDNGASWAIDSETFRFDTIEEMHMDDARHGHIASWYRDTLFMWYYQPDETSGVAGAVAAEAFSVFPNPASMTLQVNSTAKLTIYDCLGRHFDCPSHDQTMDISGLPAGVYYVTDGLHFSRFLKIQ